MLEVRYKIQRLEKSLWVYVTACVFFIKIYRVWLFPKSLWKAGFSYIVPTRGSESIIFVGLYSNLDLFRSFRGLSLFRVSVYVWWIEFKSTSSVWLGFVEMVKRNMNIVCWKKSNGLCSKIAWSQKNQNGVYIITGLYLQACYGVKDGWLVGDRHPIKVLSAVWMLHFRSRTLVHIQTIVNGMQRSRKILNFCSCFRNTLKALMLHGVCSDVNAMVCSTCEVSRGKGQFSSWELIKCL